MDAYIRQVYFSWIKASIYFRLQFFAMVVKVNHSLTALFGVGAFFK